MHWSSNMRRRFYRRAPCAKLLSYFWEKNVCTRIVVVWHHTLAVRVFHNLRTTHINNNHTKPKFCCSVLRTDCVFRWTPRTTTRNIFVFNFDTFLDCVINKLDRMKERKVVKHALFCFAVIFSIFFSPWPNTQSYFACLFLRKLPLFAGVLVLCSKRKFIMCAPKL